MTQTKSRPLALHQITAMTADPAGLLRIAAQAGCASVCLFTHVPQVAIPDAEAGAHTFPMVTAANLGTFRAAMAETGVGVSNIEFFPVAPGLNVDALAPAFAIGAEIGAARIVTHIHDADDARAVDTLGRLTTLAASHGLATGLEFMGLTPPCASIQRAAWFVDQVARPELGLAVDMLHLVRTGGTAADVAALAPRYFSYGQLCDGRGLHRAADYLPEAMDRTLPGQGDFPLAEILAALPAAVPLDVEVPNATANAGGDTAAMRDHAMAAVQAARALVDAAPATR